MKSLGWLESCRREQGLELATRAGIWWACFIDSCAASIGRRLMPIDALVLLHRLSRHATAIQPRSNRKTPIEYEHETYKRRDFIQAVSRIATRYEKTARAYLSTLRIAAAMLWIKTINTA
jgi:hypothetical protein